MQGVISSDPDVVISVHGTNDSLSGRDIAPATTESNLRSMIQQFQAADIEVLLTGTFGLWPNETFNLPGFELTADPGGQRRRPFEAIFPRLASEFGLELFNPYHGNTLDVPGLNQGDGVHPNAAGVAQIAGRLVPQAMLAAAASGALVAPSEPLLLANGTIEVWFNADDVSARQGLFSKDAAGQGTGGHISAAIQNGVVSVGIEGLTGGAFVQGAVQADTDTHLVFTFGAGGMQLFINGVLVDSDGFTGGLDIGVDGLGNFEPLVLGALIDASPNRSAGTPTNSFAGTLDELAIYDRALTADEIQQLFAAGERGGKLIGTVAADELIGGVDDETLRGRAGDDDLQGGAGNDVLKAAAATTSLQGGDGDDTLFGGGGLDDLRGEAGDDLPRGPRRPGQPRRRRRQRRAARQQRSRHHRRRGRRRPDLRQQGRRHDRWRAGRRSDRRRRRRGPADRRRGRRPLHDRAARATASTGSPISSSAAAATCSTSAACCRASSPAPRGRPISSGSTRPAPTRPSRSTPTAPATASPRSPTCWASAASASISWSPTATSSSPEAPRHRPTARLQSNEDQRSWRPCAATARPSSRTA